MCFIQEMRDFMKLFPFKVKKNRIVGDEVDMDFIDDANDLTFFEDQLSQRPYDEGRVTSNVDGRVLSFRIDTTQSNYSEDDSATQIDEQSSYEGNFSEKSNLYSNIPTRYELVDSVQPEIRKCSRTSKLLTKLNDCVIDSNLRYAFEEYVSYAKLNVVDYCFATTLNKSVQPEKYNDVVKDNNWVKAMNNEIEDLYRNNT